MPAHSTSTFLSAGHLQRCAPEPVSMSSSGSKAIAKIPGRSSQSRAAARH